MTHNAFGLVAAIDWTPVIVAVVTLAGVVFTGWIALRLHAQLKTPSGMTIGKQVENPHHLMIGTRNMTAAITKDLGVNAAAVTTAGAKEDSDATDRLTG